jgi:hypothetical protein
MGNQSAGCMDWPCGSSDHVGWVDGGFDGRPRHRRCEGHLSVQTTASSADDDSDVEGVLFMTVQLVAWLSPQRWPTWC